MENDTNEGRDVDALCKECGHAFKVFVDRLTVRGGPEPADDQKAECPVCGCGDCRIGR